MDKILVHGGHPLSGSIKVSGSKNSSLPILAATLLTRGPCIVHRVPDLSDTHYMLQSLIHLGVQVERASGTVTSAAESVEGGNIKVFAPKLRGAVINLRGKFGPTVLGTDNVMMAAVLAEGTTVIEGAAQEPEVCDLADFLNKMGAKIEGAGTRRIIVEGVSELHGAVHDIIPDRIEAGTFLVAGAIAGNGVTVNRVEPKHLTAITDALSGCGFKIEANKQSITVSPNGAPKPLEITAEPYPGFPGEMQAQMCALLSTTEGISVITENIFPQRYMHVAELKRMGAQVQIEGASAVIQGVERLYGAPVMASDLRASAALVLAGLKAEGRTEVSRVYHIDRGYEHLDEKLSELGAHIERVKA